MRNITAIVGLIAAAHPNRNWANVQRRLHKVIEETGEIEEAYLNSTSTTNGKRKTWADAREEAVDMMIVAVDVALTPREPDETVKILQEHLISYALDIFSRLEKRTDKPNYDDLIWDIVRKVGNIGVGLKHDRRPYEKCLMNELVVFTMALVDLVWQETTIAATGQTIPDARDEIIFEVEKKLAKWAAAQAAGAVVSDNQG